MSVTLPTLPTNSPMFDRNGKMTAAWVKWFELLIQRVGKKQAASIDELELGQGRDL